MIDSTTDGRRRRGNSTKRKIVEAATVLFPEHGFTATTIAAIAVRAGVSEPTVYYSFGGKEGVLTAALDVAIAGDDAPVPTLERQWAVEALGTPDARDQLRRMTDGAAEILLRAGPLLAVLAQASATSAELAGVWEENVRRRREVQFRFMTALARKAKLRKGLSAGTAADVSALLLGPEAYDFLTKHLGWTHRQWTRRTTQHLIATVLPPAGG